LKINSGKVGKADIIRSRKPELSRSACDIIISRRSFR